MRNDLSADLVTGALGMAAALCKPKEEVIRHSDRGNQYGSLSFGKTLREWRIISSMCSKGDLYDIAAAESFFASLKTELIHRTRFKIQDRAGLPVFRRIEGSYNPLRSFFGIGYNGPEEYEKMLKVTDGVADVGYLKARCQLKTRQVQYAPSFFS